MWYESKMMKETLDSIMIASKYITTEIQYKFCLNEQTFIETPIEGKPSDMFQEFLNHSFFSVNNVEFIHKTNEDGFYNIGDFRREYYGNEYKYTIWGESDTLVPMHYFFILDKLNIEEPHILSISSRKMWDQTWKPVEHESIQNIEFLELDKHLRCSEYISLDKLNTFNIKELENDEINIKLLKNKKIDGSLLALSANLPTPFISPEQHFVREDTCAERFFEIKGIPQYHICNLLKGHNYEHPLKRTNTLQTRDDLVFKKYADESEKKMIEFLTNLSRG
jgi:hypothetical protein